MGELHGLIVTPARHRGDVSEPSLNLGTGRCTALIRTFNSEATLPATLRSLAAQSRPPCAYVCIDSNSTDRTLALLPQSTVIRRYSSSPFNYSDALNQGVELVETPLTLVISSHTSIENTRAIEFALQILERNPDVAAAYFTSQPSGTMTFDRINQQNFTGFNGVFNTCAIYRTAYLKARKFRTEVFAAEDQEWSSWLLECTGRSIARITGAGMLYNNPAGHSLRKRLREETAVALYVKAQMLEVSYLARVFYRIVRPVSKLKERWFNCLLLFSLLYHRLLIARLSATRH